MLIIPHTLEDHTKLGRVWVNSIGSGLFVYNYYIETVVGQVRASEVRRPILKSHFREIGERWCSSKENMPMPAFYRRVFLHV